MNTFSLFRDVILNIALSSSSKIDARIIYVLYSDVFLLENLINQLLLIALHGWIK